MKLFSLKNCWGEEFLNKCLNPQKSSWQSSKQEHCDTRNEEGSGYSNSSTSHRILKQSCPRIKLNPLPKVKNSWQGRWRSSSLSPSEWVTPQQQSLGMQEHTSHPWKSATHFQCLTSPKTQIQGCFSSWTHKTVQFWGLQRSSQSLIYTRWKQGTCQAPKEQAPSAGYTGKEHSSRGSSRAMPWRPLWDAENQDQHFCSLGTWWDSSGCCDSLWDPKWLNGDQAKEDPDLTAKNYQNGSWGQEVGLSIFLLFLVGCIYLLLLTTPCRLSSGCWSALSWSALKEYEDGQKSLG